MADEPEGKTQGGHRSDASYAAILRDLNHYGPDDRRLFGDIKDNLIAAYTSGVCTPEEVTKVEQAMRDYPAVREWIELAQHGTGAAPQPGQADAGRPRRNWTDTVRRNDAGPEGPDGKPPTGSGR